MMWDAIRSRLSATMSCNLRCPVRFSTSRFVTWSEMLKHGKVTVAEQLVELLNMIWQDSEVPADWKKGVIIYLPKKEISRTATIGEESHYFLHPAKSSAECC